MDGQTPRATYPDEEEFPWLTILLDAYHLLETGAQRELATEERRRGARIACGIGCSGCCQRPIVPVTELEICGLVWYLQKVLRGETKKRVGERLQHHRESIECPFLLDKRSCAVYPVRPLACRLLHVFGAPCDPAEMLMQARSQDVWSPGREVARPVIFRMLTYFGFSRPEDKLAAFESGYIAAVSRVLGELHWEAVPLEDKE